MKNRHFSRRLIAMLLVLITCISLIPMTAMTASAATTTPYYLTNGTWERINPRDGESGTGRTPIYGIYMYGNSTSGSGTLQNYSAINWDQINFYIDCDKDLDNIVWFYIRQNGHPIINTPPVNGTGGASRVLYTTTLADGDYSIDVIAWKRTSFLFFETTYEYGYDFYFTVDRTPPTITGATHGVVYKNAGFTVSASDSGSEIKTFYCCKPGESAYSAVSGTSITIPKGSATGYYYFLAYDKAGNKTDTCYVYYDNVKPTGKITTPTSVEITEPYTSSSFEYHAFDQHTDISERQYKSPSSSTWTKMTTAGISSVAAEGTYYFRCKDWAGNYSDVSSITLDTSAPTTTLYADSKVVANKSVVVANSCKATFSDNLSGVKSCYVMKPGKTQFEPYTAGTTLYGLGDYIFYSVDVAKNEARYQYVTLVAPEPDPVPTYTVSYNANGGSGAPASQVKTQDVPLYLTTSKPTRTGYTFKGWSTSSSSQTVSYASGGTYYGNASITLYAVWERNSYSVSYYANGGSGAPSRQTKYYGTPLTLSSVTPTRSGYTFIGWATSSTSSYVSYNPGNTFSGNYGLNLYAVWEKNPQVYTVTYNANGGSGAPTSQTKVENVNLTLSSSIPTRQYYSFLGWATSANSSTVAYAPGDTYTQNASATLYAVWQYSPETYTVRYNANGGSGAPSAQTKVEDVSLTLSSSIPTRQHYSFLGWSSSSTATSPEYRSGDSYTANQSTTLYAVWQKDDYDLSVTSVTVEESDIYRYGTATVKIRTDSWDKVNPYSDIPVDLYYDGKQIGTQYVDFSPYGVANVTFRINVGDTPGNHTLEARINWSDRYNETKSGNNSTTKTITVKDYEYEMSANAVNSGDDYHAGTTVVSSFTLNNDSEFDITPDLHNKVAFSAYYYNGTQKVVLTTQTKDDVVIPSYGTNLVYFKWSIPQNLSGKTVYTECTVNANGSLNEDNRANNTITTTKNVQPLTKYQTPNTRYEDKAPSDYAKVNAPSRTTEKATWTEWVYENGEFVLKKYGVQISTGNPSIAPASSCATAIYSGGTWHMKSGYGIDITYTPGITSATGYSLPESSAYTSVQNVTATFPEYKYLMDNGKVTTLDNVSGRYLFPYNFDADGDGRIHFTPVYVENGEYSISVTVDEVWTPVGVISATRTSNPIIIEGTIYDDYYQ